MVKVINMDHIFISKALYAVCSGSRTLAIIANYGGLDRRQISDLHPRVSHLIGVGIANLHF